MKQVELHDLQAMVEANDNTPLALHWEAQDGHETTTAAAILADMAAGKFTPEQFEKIGYCVTMADLEKEAQP
jgi:hypothetical protein